MTRINKNILMSDARHFSNDKQINPYYHKESIDHEKANLEHKSIRGLLIQAGVNVISVPSPVNSQDGVYTANWGLARGDKVVLSRLPSARKAEEPYAKKVFESLGLTTIEVPDGLKFSGQGDALACGDLLFCGSSYRSDIEAQKFAAEALGYTRIQLKTIPQLNKKDKPVTNKSTGWPDSFFYDIDLAIAIIKAPSESHKGLVAYCPEAFTPKSRKLLKYLDTVDKIEVSLDEAQKGFATNLVSTGSTVIMSANAPKLAEELKKHGLSVLTPGITELSKGGGYIRCTTLTIY
jgi:N-dimethylarginine dimethylaminohydrolase